MQLSLIAKIWDKTSIPCLSVCVYMSRSVLHGVFFRPQWLCDESLWPSRHLPVLQLGQTNELDPDAVIIRLMTVFRYKMTKINGEKVRWRDGGANPWLKGD